MLQRPQIGVLSKPTPMVRFIRQGRECEHVSKVFS